MKFIHMADMHFDAPFTVLNTRANFGEKRRIEQREIFKKIITYIKENHIEYLFISGDLYEHEHIRDTTITYINYMFQQIPNTKIYITPGNHDPYIVNSMYRNFQWSSNVTIFKNNVEIVENEQVDIYGIGFNDFYFKNADIEKIQIKNPNKINILITHGTLDGSNAVDLEYNPLSKNKLNQLGFHYIALGHIHKSNYKEREGTNIIYPGSTVALGFDELGEHGVILGDITQEKMELKFLPFDQREFKEQVIDVTQIYSIEELIEAINQIEIQNHIFYKIILTGKRNFEINPYDLLQFIFSENIIKIKNETEINFDIYQIKDENNLKGIFLKEILEDEANGRIEKNIAEKIIEIGLDVLK